MKYLTNLHSCGPLCPQVLSYGLFQCVYYPPFCGELTLAISRKHEFTKHGLLWKEDATTDLCEDKCQQCLKGMSGQFDQTNFVCLASDCRMLFPALEVEHAHSVYKNFLSCQSLVTLEGHGLTIGVLKTQLLRCTYCLIRPAHDLAGDILV